MLATAHMQGRAIRSTGGLFMARRVVLAFAYVRAVLFFLAGIWALLDLEFVCLGGCEPASVPNRVIELLPHFVPFLLPGIVTMTVAWIVCLALLWRAQRQSRFRTVFAAPALTFLVSAISLIVTWSIFAQTSVNYRTVAEGSYPIFFFTVMACILLTLLTNLIVIVAGHRLRHATLPAVPAPA
jgi:hypothetical protein